MASLLKKQILKRLARFTKSLNSDDIDLNLSRGTGVLKNLELDAEYISQITNLPPWLEITSILCDNIKVEVHITKIQTKPIHIVIDSIEVHISVVDAIKLRQKHDVPARKQTGSGKYGLTEKMLDSMFVEIETINIDFTSTQFQADLFVSGVTLKCTDHEFNNCFDNLVKSRPVNNTDQSVTVFRQLSLSCIKANAKSARLTDSMKKGDKLAQSIRLNCDHSFVNFATKKRLADCSHMCSKFIIQLGVLSFILNDSELKEASNFLQHLKHLNDLTKAMEEEQTAAESSPLHSAARETEPRSAQASSYSSSSSSVFKRKQNAESSPQSQKPLRKISSGLSRNLLQKDDEGKVDISASVMHLQSTLIHEDQNIEAYQLGKKRIPPGLIVQTSVHFRVQKMDVHLCCHISEPAAGEQSLESTYIQFSGIGLDIYPDQKAGSKRHHWANFDYKFQDRTDWGFSILKDTKKKVTRVQSGTSLTLLGVSLDKLRESVICFRCVDFSISPVTTGDLSEKQRPFIASDKGSYKFAQDAPTIWIDFTAYFYPITAKNSYLIPRPNLYININPVQVTFYQETFLWFVKFIIKMAVTLKLGESEEDKQSSKKQKLGELTLIGKNQLKGMDVRIATLMTKVTIPISYPPEVKDRPDRPVAVQVDISEVIIENHTAADLVNSCQEMVKFLHRIHTDWLLKSHNEYPHSPDDLPIRPTILRNLLTLLHQNETKQKGNFGDLEKMRKTQLWHIELRHFLISLVSSLSEEDVMRPDEIMEPLSLDVWIATNIISHLKPLAELGRHLSDQDLDAMNDNPLVYYLVSVPNIVDINLKRVVFLSLMRLKDTINALKEDVLIEVRKLDRFNKDSSETGSEEGSSLLRVSGIIGVDYICVSLPLPLEIQKSVGTQCERNSSDSPPLTELYRKVSHSSLSNRSSEDFTGSRPRSGLTSLDEEWTYDDNQSPITSSLSSEGSGVNADQISITSSQMNVFDSDAVMMEQLNYVSPDFHQQSFFASFSHKLQDQISKRGHKQSTQPLKQKILSVVDLLSLVDDNDILTNGRVLENKSDVLTYVLRIYLTKCTLIPEIIGEKFKIKGILNQLSFAEEPIQVNEFIDQHNNPRKHAKYRKGFPSDTGDNNSPVIKFVAELGNHVKEKYSDYSPPPTLSVDARISGLSGAIYAAHLKAIKELVKDEVLPSPTTIPISIALQDLSITLAELPNSVDSDVNIGIESLHIVRAPNYKLSLKVPLMTQLFNNSMNIQLRERVMSDELRDEDTPLPQEQDSVASFSQKSTISSQSDFTEIEALPEYSLALLDELNETKDNYEITLALNHSMKSELEEFRSKMCSNKEVFNKTFNDVQNLANSNSTLMKQVTSLEDETRDYENEIADLKIAKRSVETLLKSKVDELEEKKKTTHLYQTEIVNLRDKLESLQLNKNSLMEILERNSEEIRELTLRNSELSELTS